MRIPPARFQRYAKPDETGHPAPSAPQASIALFNRVRAGFVAQGTTLAEWCRAHGINKSTASYALKSATHSADAAALRARLIAASKTRFAA